MNAPAHEPLAIESANPAEAGGPVCGYARAIAVLVLLLGVRPLAKGLMKKREEATTAGALPIGAADGALGGNAGITVHEPVSLERLEQQGGIDNRIDAVRGFTRDNPARAALALRDMMKADEK